MTDVFSELSESWRYRAVVENFVWTSLSVRYRRSVLGYLWSVLSPLMKYAIMGIVFEIIGRFAMPNFYGFMFIGSIYFGFLSTVFTTATTAFISNEQYIKKIYVPKLVFVLNIVLYELVNFLLVLFAVLGLLFLMGQVTFGWAWLFLPFAILVTVLFAIGVASIVAVATIYFRDLQHLVDIFFQALFFATPIFYPLSALDQNPLFAKLASLNPILYFVTFFRDTLVDDRLPDLPTLIICVVSAFACFLIGIFVIHRFNNRIIFKL